MTISKRLIHLIRSKPISQSDLEHAALFTLDAVANAIAGQNSVPGRILLDWGQDNNALHGNHNLDPGRRAMLLGGITHILELDDLHRDSVVHPGCVVVPVIWALTESERAAVNGKTALTAILHGFEAAIRVGMAVGLAHYRVFHNTATCGPFGSAMAAATLLELDDAQTIDALGNAGTQAAGLWQFLDTGAMSKHLHAGRGAEAGIVAADLASRGFTGPPEIFEGPRGFFTGLAPEGNAELILSNQDASWQLTQTSIKPWPSCRHTHPGIDGAQEIRAEMLDQGIDFSQVESINVNAYQAALDVCDRPEPETLYDAKFSLQHCVAVGLCEDDIGFSSFDEQARQNHHLLRGKINLSTSQKIDASYPTHWGTDIEVTMDDGRTFSVERADAKGDPEAPLSQDAMIKKAEMLLEFGNYNEPHQLIDAIMDMPTGHLPPRLYI